MYVKKVLVRKLDVLCGDIKNTHREMPSDCPCEKVRAREVRWEVSYLRRPGLLAKPHQRLSQQVPSALHARAPAVQQRPSRRSLRQQPLRRVPTLPQAGANRAQGGG